MKLTKEKIFTKPMLIVLIATFCCILWGSAFPCVKIGYNYFNIGSDDIFSQMLFAGIRFLLAGILIIVFGSITEKKLFLPTKDSLPSIGILSLTQTIIQYVFFYIALANTSGVNSSIINGSNNFFAIIIAFFLLKEKLSVKKIVGCILGFGGVILASISQGTVGGFNALGEGFMIISAISCALSNVLLKKFSQIHHPLILSGYQFIFGSIVMIIIGLSLGGRLTVTNPYGILILSYLALLSCITYTIWSLLLKYNGVAKISIFGFITPIAGSIMSALFLGEYQLFDWKYLVALILVALGIFIVNFTISKRK